MSTATLARPQPRVPAGLPGGGRFAPAACRAAYEAIDALAATVPEPEHGRASFIAVDAPRCPHGSFTRWAARNCCAPIPATVTALGDAQPCTGAKTDGGRCTRTTTRRDRRTGRPACHDHGGIPS